MCPIQTIDAEYYAAPCQRLQEHRRPPAAAGRIWRIAAALALVLSATVSARADSQSVVFSNAGQYFWVVPDGVTAVTVKAWGAGGAGGNFVANDVGGGGGFVAGVRKVTPGETLTVLVGAGGENGPGPGALGGGGAKLFGPGGRGGGRSAVLSGDGVEWITAGAGGGGGGSSPGQNASGGPGGGESGVETPWEGINGKPGTQTAGGAGMTPGGCDGGFHFGGVAANSPFGDGHNGSGGGGHYGGGAGSDLGDGGGGGGSSLVPPGGRTVPGSGNLPGNSGDPEFADNAGLGGGFGQPGLPGRVVIRPALRQWPFIVGVSIPTNSLDTMSYPVRDQVWAVSAPPHPFKDTLGIGWLVHPQGPQYSPDEPEGERLIPLIDHQYVADLVPDPARAVVTYTFDRPVLVNQLEVLQHSNGILQIEAFVGNSTNSLTSIGTATGTHGDHAQPMEFAEFEPDLFEFNNTQPGTVLQIRIRKTSYGAGWASWRIFPRNAAGERFVGAAVPKTRVTSGPVINAANGHTYYGLSAVSWTEAQQEAVRLGGSLVTIQDAAENSWVMEHFVDVAPSGITGAWIGLTDRQVEGQWNWVSGETSAFQNFVSGVPAHDDRDFAVLGRYDQGGWSDEADETPNLMGVVEVDPLNAERRSWPIGVRNASPSYAEFSIENAKADPAPGGVTRLPGDPEYVAGSNPTADDDFYFRGTYPVGFNGLAHSLRVPGDEPAAAWERALTTRDRTNRLHFILSPDQAAAGSRFRLGFRFANGGGFLNGVAIPGFSQHQVAVRFRGASGPVPVAAPVLVTGRDEFFLEFSAEAVGARSGPNTLEFERIAPTAPGASYFVGFDYVNLEQVSPPVNLPPVLHPIAGHVVAHDATLRLQLSATDDATPNGSLRFWKVSGPEGLAVSPGGLVEWTPSGEVALGGYPVEVAVIDTGSPARVSRGTFGVTVLPSVGVSKPRTDRDLGTLENPIRVNGSVILMTEAWGDGSPFTYQWYRGMPGETSEPIGSGGVAEASGAGTILVTTPRLTETTPFWVRVTNTNGVFGDSAAVSVVVQPPAPGGEGPPPIPAPRLAGGESLPLGPLQPFSLELDVPPISGEEYGSVRYEWYEGESGDISRPELRFSFDEHGGGSWEIPSGPTLGFDRGLVGTLKFWVRVSNLNGSSDSPSFEVLISNLTMEVGTTLGCSGGEVLVPIRARAFKQVRSFQGTLRWDPLAATFTGIVPGQLPGVDEQNVHSNPQTGILGIAWWSREPWPAVSLPEEGDGVILFYLRFRLHGLEGTSSPLELIQEPTPWRAFGDNSNGVGVNLAVDLNSGELVNTCVTTSVLGNVTYRDTGRPVPGVKMGLSYYRPDGPHGGASVGALTDSEGNYRLEFPQPELEFDFYYVRLFWSPAGPEEVPAGGVTMADWWKVRQHVLGLQPLSGSFERLAADLDRDASISVEDLRRVFEMAMGLRSPVWFLLRSDTPPENPEAPWNWYSSNEYFVNDITQSELPGRDFLLVKEGDVNGDWDLPVPLVRPEGLRAPAQEREGPVQLEVGSVAANAGETVVVPVRASAVSRLTTAQFSLQWDPSVLQFQGVAETNLKGMTGANVVVDRSHEGSLKFAWGDPSGDGESLAEGEVLFSLSFAVVGTPGGSSRIRISNQPILAELTVGGRISGVAVQDGRVAVRRADGGLLGMASSGSEAMGLWFEMPSSGKWVLESSTDLKVWSPWTDPVASGASGLQWVPIPETGGDARFYRVRILP